MTMTSMAEILEMAVLTLHKKWSFPLRISSKCDQICRKLRIWSHLLKKSLMENFIFCAVSGALLWILRVFWEQLLCRKRERLSLLNLPLFLPFLSQYVKISSKLGERNINSQDALDEFPFGAVKLLVLVQLPSW